MRVCMCGLEEVQKKKEREIKRNFGSRLAYRPVFHLLLFNPDMVHFHDKA